MARNSTKSKSSNPQSDRQKWEIIYKALKGMLFQQKTQIESLVDDRNFLEERYKNLYDRWLFDNRLNEDEISMLRRQTEILEVARTVEAKKAEVITGSKEKIVHFYERKLDDSKSELDVFKAWFDILSHRSPDQEGIPSETLCERLKEKGVVDSSSSDSGMSHGKHKRLEKEVARLKHEYEKLSVESSSKISALQTEINFVWNQYNEMESSYTSRLQARKDEIEQTTEKIVSHLEYIQHLQSDITQKDKQIAELQAQVNEKVVEISRLSKKVELLGPASDAPMSETVSSRLRSCGRRDRKGGIKFPAVETSSTELVATVATLRARVSELETEAIQKDGEIFTLSKKFETTMSKSIAETPVLQRCTSQPSSSRTKGREKGRNMFASRKEDTYPAQQVSEQGLTISKVDQNSEDHGGRRSKRKRNNVVSVDETPRLFTSQFKIPKLKMQSPQGR